MFFTRFFPILNKLKALRTHGRMLWHAFRHADTPKWIKGFMLLVVVYLFIPIDIIPDFLVLFGITDDLIVIGAAMWFLGKVIPDKVKNSLPLEQADSNSSTRENAQNPRQKAAKSTTALPEKAGKTGYLRPFGTVLLLGLLIAALASHPWVHAQFQSIGSLF
jgi:uncharacterized membrane protein YkvA (DUF1232 family)